MTDEAFETVHTVTHYFDQPLEGVANYRGQPHLYKRRFDDMADDYSDIFDLQPLDDETFGLVMRQWGMWKKWKAEFDAGQRLPETHPNYRGQNPEYDRLADAIESHLARMVNQAIAVKGAFRVAARRLERSNDIPRDFEAKWTDL